MGLVAYLFPGQGSQEVGMGRAFAGLLPAAADVFLRADKALDFPLTALVEGGPAEKLALTEHTQPAVLVASIAALEAAKAAGLPACDFVAGHSLGEWSALVAAGALSLEDAVRTVRARGRFMQEAVPVGEGAMAAVLQLDGAKVVAACAETAAKTGRIVVPANLNGPEQTVIAGHADAVMAAGEACKALGARRVVVLDVSAPFHSPLMAPVEPRLAQVLDSTRFSDAGIPVVTNVEAAPETRAERLKELLVRQVTAPVRWTDVVARLVADGCDTFVELGPGSVLGGLVKRQAPGAKVFSVHAPAKLDAAKAALAA